MEEEVPLADHPLGLVTPGDRRESFGQDGIGGQDFWAASPSQLSQHPSSLRS